MRIAAASLLLCAFASALPAVGAGRRRDEGHARRTDRSMKQLQLENLDKPYFISYRVVDSESTGVGGQLRRARLQQQGRSRRFSVEVRVGDYQLDNTKLLLLQSQHVQHGAGLQRHRGAAARRRLQGAAAADLAGHRRHLQEGRRRPFEKTRGSRKQGRHRKNSRLHKGDSRPNRHHGCCAHPRRPRAMGGAGTQPFRPVPPMPDIYTSSVGLSAASNSYIRYLNSEGTSYTRQEPRVTFNARADTQAADGTFRSRIRRLFTRKSLAGLPNTDALAANVSRALAGAYRICGVASEVQSYNGPVLAEGDAAPQLFRMVFLPNLLGVRRPMMDATLGMRNNHRRRMPSSMRLARACCRISSASPTIPPSRNIKTSRSPEPAKWTRTASPPRNPARRQGHSSRPCSPPAIPVRGMRTRAVAAMPARPRLPTSLSPRDNGLSQADLQAKFLAMVKQRKQGIRHRRPPHEKRPAPLARVQGVSRRP